MSPKRVSPELVHARLALLRELLGDLETLGDVTAHDLENDRIRRRALERILTQLVELAVSINSHLIGALSGSAPETYRQSFVAAAGAGVLDHQLATDLALAAGMRNLLVHEYGDIDLTIVASARSAAARDFAAFVTTVAQWILDHG